MISFETEQSLAESTGDPHLKDEKEIIHYFFNLFVDKSMPYIADDETLYKWNEKIYERITKDDFFKFFRPIYALYFSKFTTQLSNELYKQLRAWHYREKFNAPPNLIPFQDKLFDWTTRKIVKFDKKYEFTSTLAFNFETKHPKLFLQTMKEILPNDEDRDYILKWFAYTFTTSIELSWATIMVGPGSSGKTSLQEFMGDLQGDLVTAFSWKAFQKDVGHKTCTAYKTHALISEFSGKLSDNDMESYKSIITDKYHIARDAYECRLSWFNRCKFTITSNRVPQCYTYNKKEFFRRFRFIFFKMIFKGVNKDTGRFKKIFDTEAASVITHILVNYDWRDLKEPDEEETKQLWQNEASALNQFIVNECELHNDYNVEKFILFDRYTTFCLENATDPLTRKAFSTAMEKKGHTVMFIDGAWVFRRIQMKESEKDEFYMEGV